MTRTSPSAHDAHPPHTAPPPAPVIEVKRNGSAPGREELVRFGDLDVQLADGTPDIRGWTVRSAEGRAIGTVDDLLVDTNRMRVRYLAVMLDDDQARGDGLHRLLTPVDTARLDERRDEVLLARSVADIADCPHREHGRAPR